ncbi:monovalent cation/H+ antiporter complex subunit F [Isoptericola sp. b441]|uniref:Monovalent cation/H+ antiporter complex subunit F n=1 Tax=Actinotalea lenta TaxID=3064654 RepID=A0ABT9D620_9CELL|nr:MULTISPECIES: monovalent cation/H+ antiporter complex subunit F [unclassified Isoptericola]MDO8106275.1 monovalent cation/H+ antiporter complex subunit F [Isoptericola sp. b441]MDO8122005.1 monovalent cation/H+ antiporter complex subunit F [Isoptericola sp. b490]
MTAVLVVCTVLLTAAAVMVIVRAERGPSMLDRTIALDTLTAVVVGAVAVHAAWTGRTDTVPVMVALSLVGFVGSVAIARFAAIEPEGEGRVLSREEVAALELERLRAEDAERSAVDDEHHGGAAEGDVRRLDETVQDGDEERDR